MNNLQNYISSQFKSPKGLGGMIVTLIQNVANQKLYRTAVSEVNMREGEKLLDIGYGNGYLLKQLYKKQPVDMYGIDISEDAMEMATKKNKRAVLNNQLHLCVGDCCELTYDADTFDTVTSINTIYFWSDTLKGLSEIKRVLKSGKSFYNVVISKEHLDKISFTQIGYKKFEREELAALGEKAGFVKTEIKEIMNGTGYIVIYTK